MPFSHGSKGAVLVGGYDLTGYLTSVGLQADRDMAESSVLGTKDKAFVPGLRSGTLPLDGLFDGSASALDEVFAAALADEAGRAATYLPAGDGFGNRSWFGGVHQSTVEIATPVDGIAAANGELQLRRGPDGGLVLHALAARTIDGNGTGIDNLASTPNGGAGVIQVTAFSGFSGVVLKVQHSTDGSGWSDLLTFTTVAAARVSEVVTVTGTVNRHVRAFWDVTGSGSITFHMAFARRS